MRRAFGWIVFAVSAFMLAWTAWLLALLDPKPVALAWLTVALSLAASLLSFPPIWRNRDHDIARNLIALALVIGMIFIPIETHTVLILRPAAHH